MLLSGHTELPNKEMYWSSSWTSCPYLSIVLYRLSEQTYLSWLDRFNKRFLFHLILQAYTNTLPKERISQRKLKPNAVILMYIQQDATLHSLFYLETALHVSGGYITHHQERKQLYLQHLVFVTPLLLSTAIVEELESVWVCCWWPTPPTAHSNQFQLFHDSGR